VTWKFARGLGQMLHDELHWLDVPRPGVFRAGSDSSPVSERLRTAVYVGLLRFGRRCRHSAVPAFRQPSSQLLAVPRYLLNTYGRRAFLVAGPKSAELSPRFRPGPNRQCRLFQTFA